VKALADDLRQRTQSENEMVRKGSYELAADPTRPYVPPTEKEEVPFFNFAPLENALAALEVEAAAYDEKLADRSQSLTPGEIQDLNQRLLVIEQLLTDERGLPKRPWFRHQIYAPGYYTGYGVKTLPGVREAIEQREFDIVDEQIGHAAAAIDRVQQALAELTRELERPIA